MLGLSTMKGCRPKRLEFAAVSCTVLLPVPSPPLLLSLLQLLLLLLLLLPSLLLPPPPLLLLLLLLLLGTWAHVLAELHRAQATHCRCVRRPSVTEAWA